MHGILRAIFTQESSRIGPMGPLSYVAVTALATYYISESSSGTLVLESQWPSLLSLTQWFSP
jgi:hypothetical protein